MEAFLEMLDVAALTETEVRMMHASKLAYIGDAVYDLYMRTYLVADRSGKMHDLNKEVVAHVNASSQAKIARVLMEGFLTEEEVILLKRGRNAKTTSAPKNADPADYKLATGFEALLGYLFLLGAHDRLRLVIREGVKILEQN